MSASSSLFAFTSGFVMLCLFVYHCNIFLDSTVSVYIVFVCVSPSLYLCSKLHSFIVSLFSSSPKWEKPVQGTIKLSCTASRDCDSSSTCLADIARDCHGNWLNGDSSIIKSNSIRIAEARALDVGI